MAFDFIPLECLNLILPGRKKEKPRYRIAWDYDQDKKVVGYWVWTCNFSAIALEPSFYVTLYNGSVNETYN